VFVFAHLSDPHLSPVPVPYPWQVFNKRFTSYLGWVLRKRHIHSPVLLETMLADIRGFEPEHIVVTGDLTNIALPAEFIAARRWLEDIGSAADVTVIPGNHDACVRIDWHHSLAHWAQFMSGSREAGGREAPPSSPGDFPFVRRRGAIAFVGLTSAVPMPVTGTPAAGRLGAQQIAGLRKTLTALGREGLFRVILIHHSPLLEVSIRKALLDAPDFIDVLADAGAELVLHGHLHQSDFEEIALPGGAIPVIGVPSASARPYRGRPAARYHIYRLSGRRNAWRLDVEVREGLPGQSEFRTERKFNLDLRQGGLTSGSSLETARGLPTGVAAAKRDELSWVGGATPSTPIFTPQPLRLPVKDRFLKFAEGFAYDLIGLPVAVAYLMKRREPSPEATAVDYIRAVYCRNYWRRTGGLRRGLFACAIWPFAFAAYAARLTALNGSYVRGLTTKGAIRQLGEQLGLALRISMAPYWYYMFEIYGDQRRKTAHLYLQRYETKGYIYGLLQPHHDDGMQDKASFWRNCHAMGVKAVPVLFELRDGKVVVPEGGKPPALLREDLFVKPRVGRGGRNAERWNYDGRGGWQNRAVGTLGMDELLRHLANLSVKRDYIVQPRVGNHPDLTDVNNGALATVRIVTCRNERGSIEATDAALRMAIGKNDTVDNFHAGGIAAAVDLETGRLGPASNMGLRPGVGWRTVHPDTGAAIEGRTLPLWPQVIDLALRAHAAFPQRVVVGWDIAILPDGPAIIEGNVKPDLDIHQRVARMPMGNGRLAKLLAFNVARLLKAC
jgi:3',5'-cyclic AMP phosphodiesterase CpdA